MIIAIDGPAAAGKGTLARHLAEYLNFAYLDSGALYRATALSLIRSGKDAQNIDNMIFAAKNITPDMLNDPQLRDEATGLLASKVAAVQEVRDNLLKFQQDFASHPPKDKKGAIIDGRDIGTVVCPHADLKLFITASPHVRAKRRVLELEGKGLSANFDEIIADIEKRDRMDRERATSPLKPADDAICIDTTDLDAENAFKTALSLINPEKLL